MLGLIKDLIIFGSGFSKNLVGTGVGMFLILSSWSCMTMNRSMVSLVLVSSVKEKHIHSFRNMVNVPLVGVLIRRKSLDIHPILVKQILRSRVSFQKNYSHSTVVY